MQTTGSGDSEKLRRLIAEAVQEGRQYEEDEQRRQDEDQQRLAALMAVVQQRFQLAADVSQDAGQGALEFVPGSDGQGGQTFILRWKGPGIARALTVAINHGQRTLRWNWEGAWTQGRGDDNDVAAPKFATFEAVLDDLIAKLIKSTPWLKGQLPGGAS